VFKKNRFERDHASNKKHTKWIFFEEGWKMVYGTLNCWDADCDYTWEETWPITAKIEGGGEQFYQRSFDGWFPLVPHANI
jgi:hypothetical protein